MAEIVNLLKIKEKNRFNDLLSIIDKFYTREDSEKKSELLESINVYGILSLETMGLVGSSQRIGLSKPGFYKELVELYDSIVRPEIKKEEIILPKPLKPKPKVKEPRNTKGKIIVIDGVETKRSGNWSEIGNKWRKNSICYCLIEVLRDGKKRSLEELLEDIKVTFNKSVTKAAIATSQAKINDYSNHVDGLALTLLVDRSSEHTTYRLQVTPTLTGDGIDGNSELVKKWHGSNG